MWIRTPGISVLAAGAAAAAAAAAPAQDPIQFERQVLPVLEQRCYRCHRGVDDRGRVRKPKGELRLDGVSWILRGGEGGAVLVPGDPDHSPLYLRVILPADDDDKMPAKGQPTTEEENQLLRAWIAQGADFGDWLGEPGPAPGAGEPAGEQLPRSVALLARLAEGVLPLAETVVERVDLDGLAQIRPVLPGSPLLRVGFSGHAAGAGDRAVEALQPLRDHLACLDLARTAITDSALAGIGRMRRLVRLDLRRTAVTDRGLTALSDLSELRYLNLYGTEVTDSGLPQLAKLRNLEAVYLWGTEVTAAGAAKLAEQLPAARIHYLMVLPEAGPPRSEQGRRRRGG